MSPALLLTLMLLALTWMHHPVGAGFVWDLLNGIGFAALALLGTLHVDAPVRTLPTTAALRAAFPRHTRIAYAALALVLLHAGGLLAHDPVLLEYLEPGAPAYMLAGIATLPLLAGMVWSARMPWRRRLFADRRRFRITHRALAALLVALSVWHVAGSGFYLDHWALSLALALVALTWILFTQRLRTQFDRIRFVRRESHAAVATLALVVLHSLARNL